MAVDIVEAADGAVPTDTDADGIPDYLDTDSDADGISDAEEIIADTDTDTDTDGDGDGIPPTLQM